MPTDGDGFEIAAATNDILTREDAEFMQKAADLPQGRVVSVETGGCAIRDDVSIYLEAVEATEGAFDLDLILVESGGDYLAASFSPDLVDASIYVIDVAGGDKIPRKGGPGVTRSELLVIYKTDLAPRRRRPLRHGPRRRGSARRAPTLFASVLHGGGMEAVVGRVREAVEHRRHLHRPIGSPRAPALRRTGLVSGMLSRDVPQAFSVGRRFCPRPGHPRDRRRR